MADLALGQEIDKMSLEQPDNMNVLKTKGISAKKKKKQATLLDNAKGTRSQLRAPNGQVQQSEQEHQGCVYVCVS
jgi:hypothetical protein